MNEPVNSAEPENQSGKIGKQECLYLGLSLQGKKQRHKPKPRQYPEIKIREGEN